MVIKFLTTRGCFNSKEFDITSKTFGASFISCNLFLVIENWQQLHFVNHCEANYFVENCD